MNGFWILIVILILRRLIQHMGIEYMKGEKQGTVYKFCAYLFAYTITILGYYCVCAFFTEFILKTFFFTPSVAEDAFYRENYNIQYWVIMGILFAVGFVLFAKRAIEYANRNQILLLEMSLQNLALSSIAYFLIETASVIILPDTVTNNVRTMHILKGTVFIPLTIIASLFIFRYTKEKLEKSIEKWDGYKNRVEENLKNRNRK